MRIAVLETSTNWCSVALWHEGEISALERLAENRHGEVALPMLERLLQQAGVGAADLDAVAFGAGPGSFTGLRIACGIVQGLAFARDLPVLGISSFEAIAEEAGGAKVLACLDARMGDVYYSAMQHNASAELHPWLEVEHPVCVAPVAVRSPAGRGWIGCGSGFAMHGAALRGQFGESLAGVRVEIRPGAVAIARLAGPRLVAGEGVDAALAAPFYLRNKVALTSRERAAR